MTDQNVTLKDWPHAPVHRLNSDGIYMVTAATLDKKHLFKSPEDLTILERDLLSLAKQLSVAPRGLGGLLESLSLRRSQEQRVR